MSEINLKQLAQLDEIQGVSDASLAWDSAAASDVGRVRKVNEDAFMSSPEQMLWVVADGMGGHSRGDYASKAVVEALLYFCPQKTITQSIIALDSQIKNAHSICRSTFPNKRVGSTVAAMYVHGDYSFFLWAGDSRIYRLRAGLLEPMTTDHTVAQEKYARGELSKLRAAMHPSANVLTRAVGVNQTLYMGLTYKQAMPGDRYLLCTDGLYNEVELKDIQQALEHVSPQQAVDELIRRALKNGGRDNTTALVLDSK